MREQEGRNPEVFPQPHPETDRSEAVVLRGHGHNGDLRGPGEEVPGAAFVIGQGCWLPDFIEPQLDVDVENRGEAQAILNLEGHPPTFVGVLHIDNWLGSPETLIFETPNACEHGVRVVPQ